MVTRLQEARQRVRDAEEARIALAAKHAAEDAAQEPAKVALERHEKRNRIPVVVLTAGSYRIYREGVVSLSGYGWAGEVSRAVEGYKTVKAREERAAAMIEGGGVTFNLGGSSMKCRGLAAKSRIVTGADLTAWTKAHERTRRAEEAARTARNAEVAAIRAAFEGGGKITAPEIAAIAARTALLGLAVHKSDQWRRDREIADARKVCEAADAHLAGILAKSGTCACLTCEQERKEAEYAAAAEVRRKAAEKAAATAQKVKDRAPWREYTCPSCAAIVTAQPLPKVTWDGTTNGQLYLRCTVERCRWFALASAVKSKPAKKPEAVAA